MKKITPLDVAAIFFNCADGEIGYIEKYTGAKKNTNSRI
jgi:hypothetical protein